MKRLTALIAFGLMLGTLGAAQAQQPQVFIPSLTAAPGETVTVPIQGDENLKNVGGFQFELDFGNVQPAGQPNLTVVSSGTPPTPTVTNGNIITEVFLPPQGTQPPDSPTRISGAIVGNPTAPGGNGPGTLVSVQFVVPNTAANGTVYSLSLVPPAAGQPGGTSLSDPSGTTIPATLVGGTLTIQKPAPPPAGTLSVTSGGVQAGQVTVNVVANDQIPELGGIDLTLTYDPAVLSLPTDPADLAARVTLGDLLPGAVSQANVLTPGTLKVAALAGDQFKAGPGTVVSVLFDVAPTATGTTAINLAVDAMVNPDADLIQPAEVQSGTVEVAVAQVSIGSATAEVGQTANVAITLNDAAKNVAGANLVLNLGSDVTLDPTKITNGEIIKGTVQIDAAPVEGQPGQFRVAIIGSEAGNGPGTLLTLPLAVKAAAPAGETALSVVSAELRDINGAVIASQIGTGGTLTITVPPPTPAGTIAIQAVTAAQGGRAVVNVTADADFKDIGGVELTLTYDPNVLSLPTSADQLASRVTLGGLLAGGVFQANVLSPGTLKIAALAGPEFKSGPGTLLSVAFDVAGTAPTGASNVGLQVNSAVNSGGNPISPATVNGGAVTVSPFGDLNGNGVLDIEDIRLGIQLLFQAQPDPARVALVDVNGNGRVDLKDLRILLRRVLNLPNP